MSEPRCGDYWQIPAGQVAGLRQSVSERQPLPTGHPVTVAFTAVQSALQVPHASTLPSSQASPGSARPLPQTDVHTPAVHAALAQSPLSMHPTPPKHPVTVEFTALQSALQVPHASTLPSSQASSGSWTPLPQIDVHAPLEQTSLAQSPSSVHPNPPVHPVTVEFTALQSALQTPHASTLPSSQASPGSRRPLPQTDEHSPLEQVPLAQSPLVAHPNPPMHPVTVPFAAVQLALQVPHASTLWSSQTSPGSVMPLPHTWTQTWLLHDPLRQSPLYAHGVPSEHPVTVAFAAVQSALQVPHASVLPSSQTSPVWTTPSPHTATHLPWKQEALAQSEPVRQPVPTGQSTKNGLLVAIGNVQLALHVPQDEVLPSSQNSNGGSL
jgi:hypothetical protein